MFIYLLFHPLPRQIASCQRSLFKSVYNANTLQMTRFHLKQYPSPDVIHLASLCSWMCLCVCVCDFFYFFHHNGAKILTGHKQFRWGPNCIPYGNNVTSTSIYVCVYAEKEIFLIDSVCDSASCPAALQVIMSSVKHLLRLPVFRAQTHLKSFRAPLLFVWGMFFSLSHQRGGKLFVHVRAFRLGRDSLKNTCRCWDSMSCFSRGGGGDNVSNRYTTRTKQPVLRSCEKCKHLLRMHSFPFYTFILLIEANTF